MMKMQYPGLDRKHHEDKYKRRVRSFAKSFGGREELVSTSEQVLAHDMHMDAKSLTLDSCEHRAIKSAERSGQVHGS